MQDTTLEKTCPGCGLVLPSSVAAETHPYLGASPSCWALYAEVLQREYSDFRYMRVHRVTVDAYCVQHPGTPGPRTIQSLNLHLVGLYLTFERGSQPTFIRRVMDALTREKERMRWMEPPVALPDRTVADVFATSTAETHAASVIEWGRAVWSAWGAHHRAVAQIADTAARRLA